MGTKSILVGHVLKDGSWVERYNGLGPFQAEISRVARVGIVSWAPRIHCRDLRRKVFGVDLLIDCQVWRLERPVHQIRGEIPTKPKLTLPCSG